jgi:hypothetical protein
LERIRWVNVGRLLFVVALVAVLAGGLPSFRGNAATRSDLGLPEEVLQPPAREALPSTGSGRPPPPRRMAQPRRLKRRDDPVRRHPRRPRLRKHRAPLDAAAVPPPALTPGSPPPPVGPASSVGEFGP